MDVVTGRSSTKKSSAGRLLFVMTALVLVCAVAVIVIGDSDDSDAFSTFTVDGIKYKTTSDTTVEVTSESYSGSVTIPEAVTYSGDIYSVTSVGNWAFSECTSLTSVTIPNSVTSISQNTFHGCTSLNEIVVSEGNTKYCSQYGVLFNKDVTELIKYPIGKIANTYVIPNGITSIGDYAFEYCSYLTSVIITDSVTSISNGAFYGCTSLASVNISDSVTSIGYSAFSECTSLISIILPNSITSISGGTFYGCTSLVSVIIPDSVTSIGSGAFEKCSSLTSVTIPNSITSISGYLFNRCTSLVSVIIPDSVTSIGQNTFSECTSLTSVVIPDSVTSIGWGAFQECASLVSINIPNSVTSIGQDTFNGCTSLVSVIIPDGITSIGWNAFYECTSLTSVTIPDSVTSIGSYAFYRCSSLTSVTIPNHITSISNSSFCECTSLTSVTIPDSVTSIGNYAFYRCSSLTSVTIPNYVTSIEDSAFYECTSLASVTIGNSITSIGNEAFSGCASLATVYNNSTLEIDRSTSFGYVACYAKDVFGSVTDFSNGTLKGRYNSTSRVASISGYDGSPDELVLDTVVVAAGTDCAIVTIEQEAFKDCSSLISVTIGNSVTSIGCGAFEGCTSLTSVIIPDSVSSLGDDAFKDCSSLTSVTIGNSVTSIGCGAFEGCTSLASVNISDSVTSIGDDAFRGCTSLISVIIPDSVTLVGCYSFSGCTSLTSVTIGNSVASIEQRAFRGCTSLTSVVIPESALYIGAAAFSGCTFYDFDGTTEIIYYSELRGYRYIGSSSSKLIRYDLENIFFDENGGSEEIKGLFAMEGDTFVLPNYIGTKIGHVFGGWSYEGGIYQPNDTVTKTETDMTFTAVWILQKYHVLFRNGDEVVSDDLCEYGTAVVLPATDPHKESTAEYEYIFTKWDGYTEGMTVTGDHTFDAVFKKRVILYKLTFMDADKKFYSYSASYGADIRLPESVPSRQSDGNIEYRFASWNGYSYGMKVTGDMTFTSSFETVLKNIDASGSAVKVDLRSFSDINMTSEIVDSIRTAGKEGKSTDISMSNGIISFDSASAAGLPEGEQTISFTETDRTKIPAGIADKIGDRPVYSISVGNVHNFNGILTISVRYDLKEGEKAEDVCIWYLKDDGSYEMIACTYSDGYATFTTNHLSDYAVMVESNSEPVPSNSSSDDNGGGMNIGIIIGIAVTAVIVIALIAVFVIKGKKRSGGQ